MTDLLLAGRIRCRWEPGGPRDGFRNENPLEYTEARSASRSVRDVYGRTLNSARRESQRVTGRRWHPPVGVELSTGTNIS